LDRTVLERRSLKIRDARGKEVPQVVLVAGGVVAVVGGGAARDRKAPAHPEVSRRLGVE